MATAPQIHALLRFLSQDAKIPLATSMGKVKELQKAKLNSPDEIAKADFKIIQDIFPEEKLAKQVSNAAKKLCKKRGATGDEVATSPSKKAKKVSPGVEQTPFEIETSLALPEVSLEEDDIAKTILLTNRAPLVLAFAVTVIKYTMPEQPISSRLSLAQAVVSANSRTKAVSLGIDQRKTAEDEGWGEGQPTVKIMGREIKVLKRWGYDWKEGAPGTNSKETALPGEEAEGDAKPLNEHPALWGLDLEALRKSNDHKKSSGRPAENTILPIHTPDSARTYLLKSFSNASEEPQVTKSSKSKTFSLAAQEKEKCLGILLHAIDLLCKSWASTLSTDELDRRAWSWYVHVRPEIQSGPAGWGEKGRVELSKILDLRRST
ncbi:hypothetical protein FQN54_003978 [Arachnomyces sp. PD_36]|nr:hypothetical protein FQN54_003978 [Arachnomyces sp. PD_36]